MGPTCKLPLSSILGCFHLGRWPLMLRSWSRIFPLRIPYSYLMHHGLHCPILTCVLIPHPTMPRYHAILVVSLKPLVMFQNIAMKCWFYVSLNNIATLLGNVWRHTTLSRELAIVVSPIELFAFKCNWMPILHEHPIDSEITHISVDFKWFNKV